jgi:hypothetical protein
VFNLIGQENADSLYKNILSNRGNGNLSIILVDKAIVFEKQKTVQNPERLSELLLYRGELLQSEKRYDEAILTYTACLNYQGDKWISDTAHFNRGLVYDTLGSIKCRQNAEERLAAAQLFWFGQNFQSLYSPPEFRKAESDYRTSEKQEAKERLLQLYLVMGNVHEAETLIRELDGPTSQSDEPMKLRLKAYDILLCESKEDFQGADRLRTSLGPNEAKQAIPILDNVRARRQEKPIRFDWVDQIALDADASLSVTQSDVETRSYSMVNLNCVTKRLLFEGFGGGFLVSGKAGAFGLANDGRSGYGMNLDVLGTFLGGNLSAPGAGFSLDFKSFEGSGRSIMQPEGRHIFESNESGFGFNLNGGIKHKLFAFAGYNQRSVWLNGLSDRLSIANGMFESLGIPATEARRTEGVYGLGSASTGWRPGRTHVVSAEKSVGFTTHLSRNFTFGAAFDRMISDLTDQDELTVNGLSRTYVHNIFFSERIDLLRLNAEIRFDVSSLRFAFGGHHSFECSSGILFNNRSAQVVKSLPEPNGIHETLLNYYKMKMSDQDAAFAKNATGYLPSASNLYLKLNYSSFVFSAEYSIHGLRAKNAEIRFSVGIKSSEKFLSQCLHDLALRR